MGIFTKRKKKGHRKRVEPQLFSSRGRVSKPQRRPDPPPKKSRSITLAILGAVTLCGCCCCLAPAPRVDEEVPAGGSESGDF